MNVLSLRCVFWKEYRQQRSLWLSIVLLTVLLEVSLAAFVAIRGGEIPVDAMYRIALGMPMLYALGCGAVMFAGEDESATHAFLSAMPVSASKLHVSKLALAVLSALLLVLLLWPTAWVISGGQIPVADLHTQLWLGGLVTALELLAWSAFFSLLFRRVLWAAIMAGVAAFALISLSADEWDRVGQPVVTFTNLPFRATAAVAVLLLTFCLSRRWLREFRLPWDKPRARRPLANTTESTRTELFWPAVTKLGRMVWQEWRQSRATLLVVCSLLLIVAGWLAVASSGAMLSAAFVVPLPALGAILGACVFLGDQRRDRYRFFAERGIGARLVWLSRHLVWAPPVALWAVLSGVVCVYWADGTNARWLPSGMRGPAVHTVEYCLGLLGLAILFYTIGQACSLFIRSGLVALIATLACCGNAAIWVRFVMVLSLPYGLALAPIPIILMCATWLHAPNWVMERKNWRLRMRAIGLFSIPCLVMLAALAFLRSHEIPRVVLPFNPEEIQRNATPQELQTARLYQEAWRLFELALSDSESDSEPSAAQQQQAWMRPFLAATGRDECWFAEYTTTPSLPSEANLDRLAQAILQDAHRLEAAGELDAALDHYFALLRFANHLYQQPGKRRQQQGISVENRVLESLPHWAARTNQSSDRIRRAQARLEEELAAGRPQWRLGIAGEYVSMRQRILDHRWERPARVNFPLGRLGQQMFWEESRMLRLLDLLAAREVMQAAIVDQLPSSDVDVPPFFDAPSLSQVSLNLVDRPATDFAPISVIDDQVADWARTTPLLTFYVENYPRRIRNHQMWRRVAVQQLALAAWREEHGQLPRSLKQLVGNGLQSLAVDPYTWRTFQYQPEGSDFPMDDSEPMARDPVETTFQFVQPHQPFL